VTLNVALWPAPRFSGRFKPVTLKPDPVAVTCEMVTLELPELVSVSDKVLLLPVWIVPKLRLEGVGFSVPSAAAVPDNPILSVGLDALLTTAKLPLSVPLVAGAKLTLKVVL
jgi:hypothetical protein